MEHSNAVPASHLLRISNDTMTGFLPLFLTLMRNGSHFDYSGATSTTEVIEGSEKTLHHSTTQSYQRVLRDPFFCACPQKCVEHGQKCVEHMLDPLLLLVSRFLVWNNVWNVSHRQIYVGPCQVPLMRT